LYGISLNPDTNDYILVQKYPTWISGNEKIDDFIQKRQLIIEDYLFEWIPYSQFNKIKEMGKNGPITIYSAIWKDGPLLYGYGEYIRDSNKEVSLKCLHYSQNSVEFVINEVYILQIFNSAFKYNIFISIFYFFMFRLKNVV
jgi:hypothetical protein